MLKNNRLVILILFLFLFSLKSLAVPRPEYINWRASPREFVISLYEGIFESVTENNILIDNMALQITSEPQSRLDLFWQFLDSPDYRSSMWGKQLNEYDVYYKYVTVGNNTKSHYYVAKQASGAHMFRQGQYTFGVAMCLRDYHATFDPRSLEFGELWNFVPRYLRYDDFIDVDPYPDLPDLPDLPDYPDLPDLPDSPIIYNPEPIPFPEPIEDYSTPVNDAPKCPVFSEDYRVDTHGTGTNERHCAYHSNGKLYLESEWKDNIRHGIRKEYREDGKTIKDLRTYVNGIQTSKTSY